MDTPRFQSIQDIRAYLRSQGALERHEMRVLRLWTQAKAQDLAFPESGPARLGDFA
jgi:hypothetical protein